MNFKAVLKERASNQVLACRDFSRALEGIDFDELSTVLSVAEDGDVSIKAVIHDEDGLPLACGERGYSVADGVATIKVRGLLVPDLEVDLSSWGLTGYDLIEAYLGIADADAGVSRAILDIDSGGGFVQGLNAAVAAVERFSKPIETYASGGMYSAAYWLGCTPDNVAINPNGGAGSIGVYIEHFDRSENLAQRGVSRKIFKSGFWKGAFSPFAPLSEREEERLQSEVDGEADNFFGFVSDKRGISKASIRNQEGDVFMAEDALRIQLVDEIRETSMSGNTTAAASAASAPATGNAPEQASQQTAPAGEATFTQAQMDAAIDKAIAKRDAEATAAAARATAVNAVEQAPDEMKALVLTEPFASVPVESLTELLALTPKSFTQASEEDGGAGVESDNNDFAPKGKKADEQERIDTAAAKRAELGSVL